MQETITLTSELETEPSSVRAAEQVGIMFQDWASKQLSRDAALRRIEQLLADPRRLPPNYVRPRAFVTHVRELILKNDRPVDLILQEEAIREASDAGRIARAFADWGKTRLPDADPRPILVYAWSGRVVQALRAAGEKEWAESTDLLIAEGRVKSAPRLTSFGDGAEIWRALNNTRYRKKDLILDIDAADMLLTGEVKRLLVGAQAFGPSTRGRCTVVATQGTNLLVHLAQNAVGVEVNILAESGKFKEHLAAKRTEFEDVLVSLSNDEVTDGALRTAFRVRKDELFEIDARLLVDEEWATKEQRKRPSSSRKKIA